MTLAIIGAGEGAIPIINKAKEMANLDSAQLVNYKPKLDYFKDLFESKNESPIPSVKTLIEGQTPQFMYMWTAGGSYSEN